MFPKISPKIGGGRANGTSYLNPRTEVALEPKWLEPKWLRIIVVVVFVVVIFVVVVCCCLMLLSGRVLYTVGAIFLFGGVSIEHPNLSS